MAFLANLLGVVCLVVMANAQAVSVPPSLLWEGADGSWSTFTVRIGSPSPQTVNLLPGTSANAGTSIWVVLPEGCTLAAPNVTSCEDDRGGLFYRNQSSTWSTQRIANKGLFELATFEESKLGLDGAAYYGFDTVQLGYDGSSTPALQNQLIAGMAGYDFWIGSLGLSPLPFNFTDFDDPVPSYLSSLREQKLVGSSSWAYTAGASYHDPPVFGSLTLGGHDRLRWDEAQALKDVPFGADSSRDLLIGLQSISYDTLGSDPLLSEGVYAFFDSMVTNLWLPVETCVAFEKAFDLTWNETDETYWVSDKLHNQLMDQNPSLTFTLGATTEPDGSTINIVLPYSAFDLSMKPPFAQESTHYFPLKRAQNSSQITLGRVFLQEAFVMADYDRSTFTVAQALFPTPASAVDVVENAVTSTGQPADPEPSSGGDSTGLSKGALAGIVVAACAVLAAIVAGLLLCRRRRKRRLSITAHDTPNELSGSDTEVYESAAKIAHIGGPYSELDHSQFAKHEMDTPTAELYGLQKIREMSADTSMPVEKDDDEKFRYELADSTAKANKEKRHPAERHPAERYPTERPEKRHPAVRSPIAKDPEAQVYEMG